MTIAEGFGDNPTGFSEPEIVLVATTSESVLVPGTVREEAVTPITSESTIDGRFRFR